jgi:hypothetical protein
MTERTPDHTLEGHEKTVEFCSGYVSSHINTERERTQEALDEAQEWREMSFKYYADQIVSINKWTSMNRRHAATNVALSFFNLAILIYYLYLINQQNGMFDQIGAHFGI